MAVLGLLGASACATTALQSTRRLPGEQSRASLGVDLTGAVVLPRFGFTYEHGVRGAGDVSVFAATALVFSDLAGGGRLYAGPLGLSARAGLRASHLPPNFGLALTAELRATTLTSDRMPFYAGLFGVGYLGVLGTGGLGPLAEGGLVAGYEGGLSRGRTLQIELCVTPVSYSGVADMTRWQSDEIPLAAKILQLGVALHY